MGLIDDFAATRVHVLVLGVPGRPLLRLRAAAAVRSRGWVLVAVPEDADVLLVCGAPADRLQPAVDALWARVPAPRARRTVLEPAELAERLDSAVRVLGDRALQRTQPPPVEPGPAAPLRFGPLLPDWPAGLVVDCEAADGLVRSASAHVDPVREAEEDPLPADDAAFVLACDRAARLLRAAGWPAEARRLDRAVDLVLGGATAAPLVGAVRRSAARASRSALLRLAVAGAANDLLARLLVILGDAERAATGEPTVDAPLDPQALAASLVGRRVQEVRLVVAAAGPEPAESEPAESEPAGPEPAAREPAGREPSEAEPVGPEPMGPEPTEPADD